MPANPACKILSQRKLLGLSALAGAIALGTWGWPIASSGNVRLQKEPPASYRPIESISYNFGSKFMSGYFVEQASHCLVTLLVIERTDPDKRPVPPTSAVRVRLVLSPGQIAGLDSEEGRSLNVTCGDQATALLVNTGERNELVALQKEILTTTMAKSR